MLVQLQLQIHDLLRQSAQLPEPLGQLISDQVIALLRAACGGETLYIGKSNREALHRAVRADFNGSNGREVRVKHKISRATFYRIIGLRPQKA